MIDELIGVFEKLLAGLKGATSDEQMQAIDEAGFCDALRSEADGGAGLTLAEAQPLIFALGYHGVEAPIARVMVTRADKEPSTSLLAALAAAEIAGTAARVLEMSLEHANDRVQFGKPIGKQQVVQHNLAVMAEQVVMARIAGQMGCSGGLQPAFEIAATAKHVASIAALHVATLGHAVHGAIGITREHALHRFTAKLHRLRLVAGGESWWAEQLGKQALGQPEATALELVRRFG